MSRLTLRKVVIRELDDRSITRIMGGDEELTVTTFCTVSCATCNSCNTNCGQATCDTCPQECGASHIPWVTCYNN